MVTDMVMMRNQFVKVNQGSRHKKLMEFRVLKSSSALSFVIVSMMLLVLVPRAEARVEVLLDRNDAYVSESVTLVIESTVPHGPSPDVAALRKDFDVTVGNTSTRSKIINGSQFSLTRWTYSLSPKKTGEFTIPSIVVRGEISVPQTLRVTEVPAEVLRETATHAKVELEIVGGEYEPYVQQQLILSLRLLYDDTVTSGESTDPEVQNAVVEPFRGEQTYTTERDGRQYHVYEQRFVISAETSGEIVIPPVTFSGTMSTGDEGRRQIESSFEERVRRMLRGTPLENDPFFMEENYTVDRSNTGRPFKLDSNEIRLNVRARPEGIGDAAWLPARDLQLIDSWVDSPPQMQAGQPVQRRILLKAKGLVASQIPDLEIAEPDGVRMYMEPAYADTPTDSQSINGQREHIITYIPDHAGELVIPEVAVDWWNVEEDSAQTAQLEARKFDVLPGTGVLSQTDNDKSDNVETGTANDNEIDKAAPVELSATPSQTEETASAEADAGVQDTSQVTVAASWLQSLLLSRWLWSALMVAAAVWLWIWLVAQRALDSSSDLVKKQSTVSLDARLSSLQKAQVAADPTAVSQSLLGLAELRWPHRAPKNLVALIRLLGDAGFDPTPVQALERHLFSRQGEPFDAKTIRPLLNRRIWTQSRGTGRVENVDLPPLYPHRVASPG